MITSKEVTIWVVNCLHCGKDYECRTEEEAKRFEQHHHATCDYNPSAKRCATCKFCWGFRYYSSTGCSKGLKLGVSGQCPQHEVDLNPQRSRKVPILKEDHYRENWGFTVPKGTVMKYFYGDYLIRNVSQAIKDICYGYTNDFMEWRVPPSEVEWIEEENQ